MKRNGGQQRSAVEVDLDGEPVGVVELKRAVLEMIADRFGNRRLGIDVAQMALGWAAHDLIQAHLMEIERSRQ